MYRFLNSSNNTIIPYDKCIFCQAEDDNYRLSMGSCFGFTLTKKKHMLYLTQLS